MSSIKRAPLAWRFIAAQDVLLFLRSARSDAKLGSMMGKGATPAAAFDRLYAEADENDPWASESTRYRYQRGKYDGIVASPARPTALPQQPRPRLRHRSALGAPERS